MISIGLEKEIMSKVVGVTKLNKDGTDRQKILYTVKDGDRLILKRDQNNPYDENAIEVYTDQNKQIGFIKRELAEEIAEDIDLGNEVLCEVTNVTGQDKGTLGCNIKITILQEVNSRRPNGRIVENNNMIISQRHANQWNNPLVRFFYSKVFITFFICVFGITNLLLSLAFGWIYFIVSMMVTYFFYKVFTIKRKQMIELRKNIS